ncbi:MAG: response regulator [Spirochaetia bacterium]|nr:response regulator [Spirochaetia bacterium]
MQEKKISVLLVEDNEIQRKIIKEIFNNIPNNYSLTECKSAEEAIQLLKIESNIFNVILTDNFLPGISGVDFCKYINKNNINIPVIFFTGKGSEEIAAMALKEGAYDYLVKESFLTDYEVLVQAVEKVLITHSKFIQKQNLEEAIRESEKRYRTLIEMSPYGILIHNGVNILFANNMAALLLKAANSAELIEKNPINYFNKISQKIVKEQFMSLAEGEKIKPVLEDKILCFDGKKIDVEIAASYVEYNKRPAIQVVFHNITQRKNYQKQIEIAKDEAEKAVEFQNKFLSNLSHEIRTPLNAILGLSQILSDKVIDEDKNEFMYKINASGRILLDLLNDMLEISKMKANKLSIQYIPSDIKLLFTEVNSIFEHSISQKKLKLILEINKKMPKIFILDERRLKQVLVNLIGNAVKFTHKGKVKVKVGFKIINCKENRANLIFSVEDTGIGIPKNQQKMIFNEFTQQKDQCVSYGGIGLGLNITRRLVEAMNGEISLKSKQAEGSKFTVVLKNLKFYEKIPLILNNQETLISGNKSKKCKACTVLITDDVDTNRLLLKKYLDFPTIHIIEAVNGKEAIEKAKKYHPNLILMDIRMPVMDGEEAIMHLKKSKNLKKIPIIVVTASTVDETKRRLKNYCDSYLTKPVNKSIFIQEVSKFISVVSQN